VANETHPVKDTIQTKALVFWLAVLVLVAVVSVVGVAWFRVGLQDSAARVAIDKRLEAIRVAGQPLNMQDLARLYPDPPPSQDAAPLLKPTLALVVPSKNSTNIPLFGADFPPGNVPFQNSASNEIRVLIDKNQAALDSVPWEKLQGTWFGSGFQNGFTNLTEVPIHNIDTLVEILCLDAASKAEDQHAKEATQSLRRALEIGQTLKSDTILHGFAKQAIEKWVCRSMNRVVNRTILADSDLRALSDSLTRTNFGTTKGLLINERAFGLSIAENLHSLAAGSGQTASFSPVRRFLKSYQSKLIYRDQDLLDYLDKVEAGFPALDLPLSNSLPMLLALQQESKKKQDALEKKRGSAYLSAFEHHRVSLLSIQTPPSAYSLLTAEAKTVAFVRVTKAVLAIERWRLSHAGSVPDSLSALKPEFLSDVPIDPFDEKPLRYKKLGRGYVVYSIGPDFTDDNGEPEPKGASHPTHYDVVFQVER